VAAILIRDVRLLGVGDDNIDSTTALGVLDLGTGLAAAGSVLARTAIRHGVVEFQVAVKLGLDVELLDGRLLATLALVAADGRASLLVLRSLAGNALVLAEVSGSKLIPLAELILASEPTPFETLVRIELAGAQVSPVETALPVGQTEAVRVVGGRELWGVDESISCGRDLTEASSQGNERRGILHRNSTPQRRKI